MTLLKVATAEVGDTEATEPDVSELDSATANVSVITTPVLDGNRSYRCITANSGHQFGYVDNGSAIDVSSTTVFASGRFLVDVLGDADPNVLCLSHTYVTATGPGGTRVLLRVVAGTPNVFNFFLSRSAGGIGQANVDFDIAFSEDTSYSVEIKVWHVSTTLYATCRLRQSDTDDPETRTLSVSSSSTEQVQLVASAAPGNGKGGTQTDWDFDNLWMSDNQGSYNNDWPGVLTTERLLPTSDGTHTAFTASGGGAGVYDRWDEVPGDDDTTYNESGTGTSEVKQTSNVTDTSYAENAKSVAAVVTQPAARIESGSNGDMKILVISNSNEYTTTLTPGDLPVGDYNATMQKRIDETDPDTSAVWTKAAIDALEIGGSRGAGASAMRNFRVTQMTSIVFLRGVEYPLGLRRRPIVVERLREPVLHPRPMSIHYMVTPPAAPTRRIFIS